MSSIDRPVRTKKSSSKRSNKFMPNLSQLQEAAQSLPNPEDWPDDNYKAKVVDNDKQHAVRFSRKSINRGKTRAERWVYEGKVLIRKRDV